MKNKLFLFAALGVFLASCNDDNKVELEPENVRIEKYVAANNLNTTIHPSGIHYIITTVGTGANPTANDTVTVQYKGIFLDGTTFDQNLVGVEFPLQRLIEGWQIAIPLLNKGGAGFFIMPSALCYGSNPPRGIPPNAILAFEIALIDFK